MSQDPVFQAGLAGCAWDLELQHLVECDLVSPPHSPSYSLFGTPCPASNHWSLLDPCVRLRNLLRAGVGNVVRCSSEGLKACALITFSVQTLF